MNDVIEAGARRDLKRLALACASFALSPSRGSPGTGMSGMTPDSPGWSLAGPAESGGDT